MHRYTMLVCIRMANNIGDCSIGLYIIFLYSCKWHIGPNYYMNNIIILCTIYVSVWI